MTSRRGDVQDKGYAWVVLVASIVLNILFSGAIISQSVFYPELLEYFERPKAEVALIGSLNVGFSGIIGLVLGTITKQFGSRPVVIAGSIIACVAHVISAFSPGLPLVQLFLGAVQGLGIGCYGMCSILVILQYFNKHRSLAMGLLAFGIGLGTIGLPLITRVLIDEYGWRGAVLVLGAIQLQAVVCGALLRPFYTPGTGGASHSKIKFTFKSFIRSIFDFSVCYNIRVPLFLISSSMILAGHVIAYLFLPARLESVGVEKKKAAFAVTIMGITSVVLRPIFGFIGDHVGYWRVVVLGLSGLVVGILVTVSYVLEGYMAFGIYAGFTGGMTAGYMSLQTAVLGDLVTRDKYEHVTGLFCFSFGTSTVIAPPIAGAIVDVTKNFADAFLIFGLVEVVGGVLSTLTYIFIKINVRKTQQNMDDNVDTPT